MPTPKYSHVHVTTYILRSSRPDVFCKKGVLKNFAKFTGKHLCQSLFFNRVAGGACNFIKKESLAQVLSCEFCEISKSTFFYRTPLVAAFAHSKSWRSIRRGRTGNNVKVPRTLFLMKS